MKLIICLICLISFKVFAKTSCVPSPNETMCLVLGGTYDEQKKLCCISTDKSATEVSVESILSN